MLATDAAARRLPLAGEDEGQASQSEHKEDKSCVSVIETVARIHATVCMEGGVSNLAVEIPDRSLIASHKAPQASDVVVVGFICVKTSRAGALILVNLPVAGRALGNPAINCCVGDPSVALTSSRDLGVVQGRVISIDRKAGAVCTIAANSPAIRTKQTWYC